LKKETGNIMTIRQSFLKLVYPLFVAFKKSKGATVNTANASHVKPLVPFYSLSVQLNDGRHLSFESLRGRKVMLVNTASDCGFTRQYEELQELYRLSEGNLVIIGFPANDFKEQEKGTDEEIARFCQLNYGVTFPLARKSSVIRGTGQNKVFEWLTTKEQNGWNEQQPSWNFCKYIIDEEGVLIRYFDPAVSPLDSEIVDMVQGKQ
jgi:glutathione peroxidase